MVDESQTLDDGNGNVNFICGVVEGFYGKPWTYLQRRDLFKKLREFKLNTFMYAPKDDTKHRAKWRQLYDDVEAQKLKTLIDEAAANGIDFYYSLAPGLDMIYSNHDETATLFRKFDQLRKLGCRSFAILFDDIEPNITNNDDRALFNDNYASAQVLITNLLYDYLGRPNFLFCPTEYCESRAVPNVANSNYLNIIGTGLHEGIDIMWSGSRVVSRFITEESIKTLSEVIKRPPVIWENLHANDYDKKRVYLGPYSGRSTKIIPKLRGVLTNPNCEYEANHIAIHTLAQWSRCTEDINLHNRCNQDNTQILTNNNSVYDPDRALIVAIQDWLPHVLSSRSLPQDTDLNTLFEYLNNESAHNQLAKEETLSVNDDKAIELDKINIDMSDETLSSGSSVTLSQTKSRIDVDTSGSPPAIANMVVTNSCGSCELQEAAGSASGSGIRSDKGQANADCPVCLTLSQDQDNSTSNSTHHPHHQNQVDVDSLALLVDFFYLPFEHGVQGYDLLAYVRWLIENSNFSTSPGNIDRDADYTKQETKMIENNEGDGLETRASDSKMIELWIERAEKLNNLCNRVNEMVNSFIYNCPNKLLVAELYPYLIDLQRVTTMITDFVKFLRHREPGSNCIQHTNSCNSIQKEVVSSNEQEPWVHCGGLVGDINRLISSTYWMWQPKNNCTFYF